VVYSVNGISYFKEINWAKGVSISINEQIFLAGLNTLWQLVVVV